MFLLVDKPLGLSSFGTLRILRGYLHLDKIGHSGTLDPLATGLLLVATDRSTRLIPLIDRHTKLYRATIRLDGSTPSGDLDTPIDPVAPDVLDARRHTLTIAEIESILLERFTGTVRQVPPRYSALLVDGERAYDLARRGQDFTLRERTVEIMDIRVVSYTFPELVIEARVSAGTYIRVLAQDIGRAVGLAGYLSSLRRIEIGTLHVPDVFTVHVPRSEIHYAPLTYADVFPDMPILTIGHDLMKPLERGIDIHDTLGIADGGLCFVVCAGRHIALGVARAGMIHPQKYKIE